MRSSMFIRLGMAHMLYAAPGGNMLRMPSEPFFSQSDTTHRPAVRRAVTPTVDAARADAYDEGYDAGFRAAVAQMRALGHDVGVVRAA